MSVADVLQVLGIALMGVAGFLIATWLGFAVLGVGALVFGIALER